MHHRKHLLFLLLLIVGLLGLGTLPPVPNFRFPFDRYKTLAGTFGELRGNHFHSGIDVKTNRIIGIPVRAVADGHIYRIRTGPYGYGNAVYMQHEDGSYSVYAHLQKFTPEVAGYHYTQQVIAEQQAYNSFPADTRFLVQQGDTIGFSGNSGSSYGPHLHFEIRDAEERITNPLRFYMDQVLDTKKPIIQNVALQPLDLYGRVDGQFEKKMLPLQGADGRYRVPGITPVLGAVGLEYQAYDILDAAPNHCGVNYAELYLDDSLVHSFSLDTFAFDESKFINLHFDYPHFQERKQRLQRAYRATGNRFPALKQGKESGWIRLEDDATHDLRLVLRDLHGNRSVMAMQIQRDTAYQPFEETTRPLPRPKVVHEVRDNVLYLAMTGAPAHVQEHGLSYTNAYGKSRRWPPAYLHRNELVFLLPLDRHDYPQIVRDDSGQVEIPLYLNDEIHPDRHNLVEKGQLQGFFPFDAVFAPLHLSIEQKPATGQLLSDRYALSPPHVPLYKGGTLSFRLDSQQQAMKGLMVVKLTERGWQYAGSNRGPSGDIQASIGSLGEFALMQDTIPPTLRNINFGNGGQLRSDSRLTLALDDKGAGIDPWSITGFLGGKWVRFAYNFKSDQITADLSVDTWPEGEQTLEVRVADRVGNVQIKRFQVRM